MGGLRERSQLGAGLGRRQDSAASGTGRLGFPPMGSSDPLASRCPSGDPGAGRRMRSKITPKLACICQSIDSNRVSEGAGMHRDRSLEPRVGVATEQGPGPTTTQEVGLVSGRFLSDLFRSLESGVGDDKRCCQYDGSRSAFEASRIGTSTGGSAQPPTAR